MIFSFLFAGFVVLLILAWLASLANFLWAKWKKPSEGARFSSKIFTGLSATGVLTAALIWFVFFPSPTRIYYLAFGESPSPDVTHLHGFSSWGYDSQIFQLRFQATPNTIKKLIKIQNLPTIAQAKSDSFNFADLEAPHWWNPQITKRSQLYAVERSKDSGGFFRESVALLYDPQTQIAYYWFFGID